MQTTDREVNQLQSNIATALQPFQNNLLLSGTFINSYQLDTGTNTIYHSLGRKISGWVITDINAVAQIYSQQTTNLTPQTTLVLVSDVPVLVNLYVF